AGGARRPGYLRNSPVAASEGRKVTATAETTSLIQTGAAAGTEEMELADRGAISQLLYLMRAVGAAREYRLQLCVLAMALVSVVGAIAYGQIKLNAWNGSFMDLLARRDLATLGGSLVAFLVIVGGLLLLVVSQTWLQEMIKVRLREWLTHDLLDNWLMPGRL